MSAISVISIPRFKKHIVLLRVPTKPPEGRGVEIPSDNRTSTPACDLNPRVSGRRSADLRIASPAAPGLAYHRPASQDACLNRCPLYANAAQFVDRSGVDYLLITGVPLLRVQNVPDFWCDRPRFMALPGSRGGPSILGLECVHQVDLLAGAA